MEVCTGPDRSLEEASDNLRDKNFPQKLILQLSFKGRRRVGHGKWEERTF